MGQKRGMAVAILLAACTLFLTLGHAVADETDRPTLYLEGYTIEGTVAPGQDIVVRYTLRNASATAAVGNILLTVSAPDGAFFPAAGKSDQSYIDTMEAGAAYTGAVPLTVSAGAADGIYRLTFRITYQGPTDAVLESTAGIALAVGHGGIKIAGAELSSPCEEGQLTYLRVRYTNDSRAELRNAALLLDGPLAEDGREHLIGMVRPAAAGVAECYVTFRAHGELTVTIRIVYEDENGRSFETEPYSLSATVAEKADPPPVDETPATVRQGWPPETIILLAAVTVCVILLATAFVKRRW